MKDFLTKLLPTLGHALELIISALVVYGVGFIFPFVAENPLTSLIIVNALAKFGRSTGVYSDYVNGK